MEDLESEKAELLKVRDYNQDLTYELKKLKEEINVLKDIEDSAEKDRKEMEKEYEVQKKKIENMRLEKKELEAGLQNLKMNHKEELDEWRGKYEIAKNELKEGIREITKGI